MRKPRAAVAAAFVALTLVAAAPETEPSATATTGLVGLTVEVNDAPVPVDLTALDIATSATTVGDPLAVVDALIAELNGTRFGELSVRSDGRDDATSDPVSGTVLDVSPITAQATATDTAATALVSASDDVVAAVQLLGDAALSLERTVASSAVDPDRAAAAVGLDVSALDLDLGDLLGDALGELPLDALLDLADQLIGTVDGLGIAELEGAAGDVEDQLGVLGGLAGDYETDSAAVTAAVAALGSHADSLMGLTGTATLADAVTGITADQANVDGIVATAGTLLADPTALLTELNALIAEYDAVTDAEPVTLDPADPAGTLEDIVTQGTLLSEDLGGLLTQLDGLRGDVAGSVSTLAGTLDGITTAVGELQTRLQALLDALGRLADDAVAELTDALAGAGLVGVGDLEVSLAAVADGHSADARLDCVLAGRAVDCLTPGDAVDTAVAEAIGTVTDVLGTLAPGAVDGEVVLRILDAGDRSVSTGSGTNTAEATLEILRLEIPSVSLDALVPDAAACSQVLDGILCDLLDGDLPTVDALAGALASDDDAVIAQVDGAVADLGVDLEDGVDLAGSYAGAIGALDALDPVLAELADAVRDILELVLGGLETGMRTPGLRLVVDPDVTAAYTAAGAPATDDPAPPDGGDGPGGTPDRPSLPTTGGGLALLAGLALAGGFALRRRG